MKNLKKIAQLVLFASVLNFGLIGCSEDEKPKPKSNTETEAPNDQDLEGSTFIIQDPNGNAIANAQYLVGSAQNNPFEGNFGVTNERGEIFIPAAWVNPEMLTIDAPGYLRATYMQTMPKGRTIHLTKKFVALAELRGNTSGHPVRNKDDIVDFSFVINALTRQDLLNFQIQKVLSPINDVIKAVGQKIPIPSNVSLPKQTEKKFFLDVVLDKPQYRMKFSQNDFQRVFVARGRFPFDDVVDGFLGKKPLAELINFFSINGGSIRDVVIENDVINLDITVNDMTFTDKKTFKAPALKAGQSMIALAASDSNGYLIPTDFKKLNSNQFVSLSTWPELPVYIAQVLKNQNEFDPTKSGIDRLSAIISTFDNEVKSDFLPLINNPVVLGKMEYKIPAVQNSTLNQLTTYIVISDVKTTTQDGTTTKETSQVWEVYAPSWITEIHLPKWEWNKTAPLTRMEVSLVGSVLPVNAPLGPEMLEKATHVTRSSIDF